MLDKMLIYSLPLLSCLSFPSPPLFVSAIPLTHHSSSHLAPLPPVSPYLSSSALTFLSFQHVSLCVFLSLRVLFLSSPHTPPPPEFFWALLL